jgi:hypothetical protein
MLCDSYNKIKLNISLNNPIIFNFFQKYYKKKNFKMYHQPTKKREEKNLEPQQLDRKKSREKPNFIQRNK